MDVPLTELPRHFACLHQSLQRQQPIQLRGEARRRSCSSPPPTAATTPRQPIPSAQLRAAAAVADRLTNNTVAATTGSRPTSTTTCTRADDGFTYNGAHYTGDAGGDRAGRQLPVDHRAADQASQAYKNNGAIVIWYDETEGGDTGTHFTLHRDRHLAARQGQRLQQRHPVHPLLRPEDAAGHLRSSSATLPYLGAAASANTLSDLYLPGSDPDRRS